MQLRQSDIAHFKRGQFENPRFWSRFEEAPNLVGAQVLDLGSGWGSLAIDIALAGARKVVGIDINAELVAFANEYLRQCYPQLTDIVEFRAMDLGDFEGTGFDLIVSKDSFEHVIELDRLIVEMKHRLRPGGRLFAGFGPLYPSPYGDHDRRRTRLRRLGILGWILARIPWGHLALEPLIIEMNNRYWQTKVSSMHQLGLNKLSVADYRRLFTRAGFYVRSFRVNQSAGFMSRIFEVLARLPRIERYFIHNVYCILEKPG